ncbi:hypothetical protein V7266_05480 [Neobacillus drentensis]|uniref:DAPG hydrolase family protein n=1 Tax=Neobacillus drentensis TaxID=220684 RepID=UPI002FFFF52C
MGNETRIKNDFGSKGWSMIIFCMLMYYNFAAWTADGINIFTQGYAKAYGWDPSVLLGLGRDVIQINFKNPADLGYEADKIGTNTCGTIVCANCISENKLNAVMTHFVREVEGGVELRSRFWIGYQIDENKNPVKVLPEGVTIPELAPKSLINHCAKEFAHLAKILPSLFEEEKLNF